MSTEHVANSVRIFANKKKHVHGKVYVLRAKLYDFGGLDFVIYCRQSGNATISGE